MNSEHNDKLYKIAMDLHNKNTELLKELSLIINKNKDLMNELSLIQNKTFKDVNIYAVENKGCLVEKGVSPVVFRKDFDISPIKPILPIIPVSDKEISTISSLNTRSYPNTEELNLIHNPLKNEIDAWLQKHKLSIVIPSNEDINPENIQSVKESAPPLLESLI